MKKQKVFQDFQEEGVYETWIKCKTWGDAIDTAVDALEELMSRGYDVDYFNISTEDVDGKRGYSIRVTGNKVGGKLYHQGRELKLTEDRSHEEI